MSDELKIGIVGVGAVGTVFALLLKDKGYNVEITKKNTLGLTIDNNVNLEINGAFGNRSYLVPYMQNNKFSSTKDVLFIFTKSCAVEEAFNDVKDYLSPNGVVVVVQNVFNYNELDKTLPHGRFVPIVIDFNAIRLDENHVKVLHGGHIHLGAISEESKVYLPFLKNILSCVSEVVVEDDMPSFVVSRFILSNTISSVCALTGYKLGKTLEIKRARKIFVALIEEQVKTFKAAGIKIISYSETLDYEQFVEKSFAGLRYRGKMFSRLIKQNGEMVSSTLRALENKQPTELESMCARVVELAKQHNIEVPYCKAVANMLSDVEMGKRGIYVENLDDPIFIELEKRIW